MQFTSRCQPGWRCSARPHCQAGEKSRGVLLRWHDGRLRFACAFPRWTPTLESCQWTHESRQTGGRP
jgi:hypothetical protein